MMLKPKPPGLIYRGNHVKIRSLELSLIQINWMLNHPGCVHGYNRAKKLTQVHVAEEKQCHQNSIFLFLQALLFCLCPPCRQLSLMVTPEVTDSQTLSFKATEGVSLFPEIPKNTWIQVLETWILGVGLARVGE